MLLQKLCTERLPNYSFATFTYVNSYILNQYTNMKNISAYAFVY